MSWGRTRRGPRSIYADDSGSEEERAAGGAGPGAADPERARSAHSSGWRRYMDNAMDIEGARRRSHEPTAVRPELGLGWLESAHRWTGTTCRAASLGCSGWSEERDAGRARLDRVEGGDSRRTGPSRTTTKMYSWESVTSLSTVPELLRSQRFVTLLYIGLSRIVRRPISEPFYGDYI